jgi:hypothetical protein
MRDRLLEHILDDDRRHELVELRQRLEEAEERAGARPGDGGG